MPRRSDTPPEALSDNLASALSKLQGLLDASLLDDADPLALELVRGAIEHLQACQEAVRNRSSPESSQVIIADDSEFFEGIEELSSVIPSSIHASPTAERWKSAMVRTANEVPFPTDTLPHDILPRRILDPDPNASDVEPDSDQLETSEDFIARVLQDPEPSDVFSPYKDIDSSDSSINEMSMAEFDASIPSILEMVRRADPSLGPYDPHQDDDDADGKLSRIVSALNINETSGDSDIDDDDHDGDDHNDDDHNDDDHNDDDHNDDDHHDGDHNDPSNHGPAEDSAYESIAAAFRILYPGLTPIGDTSLILRCVAKRFGRSSSPKTFLQGLTLLTPSTPPLVDSFAGPRSRKGRKVEIVIPKNLRLETFVYCENLGDFYEQVVYTRILKPTSSKALTEAEVRKAFEGPLDDIKLGLLDDKAIATLESVLQSMEHVLNASREADIEHHYRRTHCEIISACLRCLGILHYARSGSSSSSKDHEGEFNSSVNASPDVEDVFGREGKKVTSATEMKTERSLKNAFITVLLRVGLFDEENVKAFKDQLHHCPGFAHRFVWPEAGVYMRVEEQAIVQVFTAMVYKKLRVYELSSSDRSVFFFRDSLESTTLYVSRVYNTLDLHATSEDPNTPDCMTNLTRFAMRYIAANDLYDEVAKLLPPAKKEHWNTVSVAEHGYGPPYGIDTRTDWATTGQAFYSPAPAEQQPIVEQRPIKRKRLRKPHGP
ncbi:uncharacterized protein SCHCODRAFT_02572093 [Schizophyllum commune H4-8]|nr:uncharacterized protein SCHCODRAFT_02572093 [Schizophyllum commune H4-8]KAI5895026.1 hypothetical protein SCHCODRAFT_02572093 [Schizophyllum commune H4-8]